MERITGIDAGRSLTVNKERWGLTEVGYTNWRALLKL
jgi:hypothetical protein